MSSNKQIKKFCFTWNNYDDKSVEFLKSYYDAYCSYMIYGYEVSPSTQTPHLQGYIELKKYRRFKQITQKDFQGRIHIEIAKGNFEQNKVYCSKCNNYIEYGTPNIAGSNKAILGTLREKIKACKTWRDVLEIEGVEKHLKFAREYYNTIDRRDKTLYADVKLYDWQQQIINYMDKPGTSREILFILDKQGGKGKSFLCAYCQTMRDDTFISDIGKTADILYIYKDNLKKNILLDTQRDLKYDEFNWKLIENITNRVFTSTKYESQIINKPELTNTIIFTNDMNYRLIQKHLSRDRIKIMDLGDDKPTIQTIYDYDENMAGSF